MTAFGGESLNEITRLNHILLELSHYLVSVESDGEFELYEPEEETSTEISVLEVSKTTEQLEREAGISVGLRKRGGGQEQSQKAKKKRTEKRTGAKNLTPNVFFIYFSLLRTNHPAIVQWNHQLYACNGSRSTEGRF